ncbi:MAG: HAMP domain-containing histidine kinase [Oscillospiraceae bacterium]|jgi:signal transduction histidine kinase|nr:HAMP domain-containing histidine kinase [Oscillospiraceae bacterium]
MDNTKTEPAGGRVRSSIARKLSSRLFFRLLGIFISLDITICILASAAAMVYAERRAADAAAFLVRSQGAEPWEDAPERWPVTDTSFAAAEHGSAGFVFFGDPITRVLPEATKAAGRKMVFTPGGAAALMPLGEADYVLYIDVENGRACEVTVRLGGFVRLFTRAFEALLVIELITLLTKSAKDRRMIRRMLNPISELARATQTLHDASARFDPDKMAALAGQLDSINAFRLDSRIRVDGAQKELQGLATAINDMLDRINESYAAQIRFVSDASHELRTPISVIQGYANLLDRWGKNDEKTLQESIGAIKDEAANMKELVEQLLFLARGDNNTIALQEETFDLKDLAEEILGETRMIDPSHTFSRRGESAFVAADRGLVKQAVRILADNAVKYTDAGGSIILITEPGDGFSKIAVSDDGIGVPAEVLPRIFDRFVRADASRARSTGGAGLGLSIAKWIAAKHGGHMEALSREGLGTRVTLVLPATETAAGTPETE